MNMSLLHASLEPLLYGVIIFLGLLSMWYKFSRAKYMALMIEIVVFILVFKLHGGTMSGGFAATVAALLAGLIMPMFLGRRNKV